VPNPLTRTICPLGFADLNVLSRSRPERSAFKLISEMTPEEGIALCTFLFVGALSSAIIERLHLTRRRLEVQTERLAALAAERTRLIETERKARSEAEAANRGKDDVLAMVAHEFRHPLAAILAAFQVLEHAVSARSERARAR
jgi:signal transduction histidine kinase